MKFVDFFAGIGGMRLGLEQAGHRCVGWCEFDKFAQKSYKAIHNTDGEWFSSDVSTVRSYDVPEADLWCFGFPCQDISVAGKQAGLESGKRSGLFFQIMRLLAGLKEEDRPKWLLVENVKNLLSIGGDLTSSGYCLSWSKTGTTRNGRYSIVKTSECHRTGKGCSLSDVLEQNVDEKYFLSAQQTARILASSKKGQ